MKMVETDAKPPIHPSVLQRASEALQVSQAINLDLPEHTFFANLDYLYRLSRNAQSLICAVQHAGGNAERPGMCFKAAVGAYITWKGSSDPVELESSLGLAAVSVIYGSEDPKDQHERIHYLARWCQDKWKTTQDNRDLDTVVHLDRAAYNGLTCDHAKFCAYATDLAVVLTLRWKMSKDHLDFEEADKVYTTALANGNADQRIAVYLSNHGELLRLAAVQASTDEQRLQLLIRSSSQQDEAVTRIGAAEYYAATIHSNRGKAYADLVDLQPVKENFQKAFDAYSQAMCKTNKPRQAFEQCWEDITRFCNKQRPPDDTSISILIELISASDPPQEIILRLCKILVCLRTFRSCPDEGLRKKFLHFAVVESKALYVQHHADENFAELIMFQSSLAFHEQFVRAGGEYSSLTSAIFLMQQAVKMVDSTLHSMALRFKRWDAELLIAQCRAGGDPGPVRVAVERLCSDLSTKINREEHGVLALTYWILGKCHRTIYDAVNNRSDLSASLTYLRTALELEVTLEQSTRALIQNDLANDFGASFDLSADIDDLQMAITHYQFAIVNLLLQSNDSNSDDKGMFFTGLGTCMLRRGLYWNSEEDTRAAISLFRNALQDIEETHVRFGQRAANLSYALHVQYSVDNDTRTLIEAQRLLVKALDSNITMSDALRQSLYVLLGNTYSFFSDGSKKVSDVDLALRNYAKASTLKNGSVRSRVDAAQNSASAWSKRWHLTQKESDSSASLQRFDDAMKMADQTGSRTAGMKLGKANLLTAMSEALSGAGEDCAQKALRLWLDLIDDTRLPPVSRVSAMSTAAKFLVEIDRDYHRAFAIMRRAIELLPKAILSFSSRLEQLRFIRKLHYFSSSATALAIAAERGAEIAISVLESTRSILWTRLIEGDTSASSVIGPKGLNPDTMTPELQSSHLEQVLKALPGALSSKDRARLDKHHLIESSTGFNESLLRNVEDGDLRYVTEQLNGLNLEQAESDGAIVWVNYSPYRCDALLVQDKLARCIPLSGVHMKDVTHHAALLRYALHNFQHGESPEEASASFNEVLAWLWNYTARPVLELVAPRIPNGQKSRRIYWVASGWMSLFPVHAAGLYGVHYVDAEEHENCPDRAISSYIPSLKAFKHILSTSESANQRIEPPVALAVGMAKTEGMSDLSVKEEVRCIESSFAARGETVVLDDPDFQKATSSFGRSELIHLACHGVANDTDPSLSAIRFADWHVKPLTVRALLRMQLRQCKLAFLSACETALNKDLGTRDEGLHLAGAFHMAGVRHTVATLWAVADYFSIKLVKAFYDLLIDSSGRSDYENAATILQQSCKTIRNNGAPPIIWAAYVHCGP